MGRNISLASFNLYNLQLPGQKVYRNVVTRPQYKAKVKWTAEKLAALDADVIGFQELWGARCLEDVFTKARLRDEYALVYIKEGDDPSWRGIAVAVAVRNTWRVKHRTTIKDFPFDVLQKVDTDDDADDELSLAITRFSRTVIHLELTNPARTVPNVHVFAAHLKAKLPSRVPDIVKRHRANIGGAISTIRRTAEAAALRWVLTEHRRAKPTAPTVVVGDLNDDPRSNTLALLTEQPLLLQTARGRATALYSALQLQQLNSFRDVYYTHEFNHMRDVLDHILVSKEFFGPSPDHKWTLRETKIWQDYIDDGLDSTSDHGIVRASFKWG